VRRADQLARLGVERGLARQALAGGDDGRRLRVDDFAELRSGSSNAGVRRVDEESTNLSWPMPTAHDR
jgi:hypothetical protein